MSERFADCRIGSNTLLRTFLVTNDHAMKTAMKQFPGNQDRVSIYITKIATSNYLGILEDKKIFNKLYRKLVIHKFIS